MVCTPLPGGGFACGTRRRFKLCPCGSGLKATLLCDWKVGPGSPAGEPVETCDKPLCPACTTKPAADKDLCREHVIAWDRWKRARRPATVDGEAAPGQPPDAG